MIVVSNTSPLTNLAAIGQFDLLRQLYTRVHLAEGVWNELNAKGQRWPGCAEVAAADWIQQHTVHQQPLVNVLRRDVDRGELHWWKNLGRIWSYWMRKKGDMLPNAWA